MKKELVILEIWKQTCFKGWSKIPEKEKEIKLKALINLINKTKKGKQLKIKFEKSQISHYNPNKRQIILNNCSIITALHELGHHLFGDSELKACRYSVWMFKETFPKTFANLHFNGHLLTK